MIREWFLALAHSALGQYMQNSKWAFAAVETVHLLALAILGGAILVIDLRLMGVIFKVESTRQISRDLGRLLLGSLTVLVVSGIALVSEEALKCYNNAAFQWKMALLAAAIIFYFTAHRKAIIRQGEDKSLQYRVIAGISITLWLGVGVAGRAIGLI